MKYIPPKELVGQALESSVRHVCVAEESDFYPSVVRLNENWRVITCRNHIQWILQVRRGSGWRNRFFFRTRAGLIQFAREYASPICGDALIILLRLPERFPEGARDRTGPAVRGSLIN